MFKYLPAATARGGSPMHGQRRIAWVVKWVRRTAEQIPKKLWQLAPLEGFEHCCWRSVARVNELDPITSSLEWPASLVRTP